METEEAIRLIKRELCPIRCENGNSMDECEARCEFKEAIKALEQKLVNISCKNCKNFNPKDNYCSLLQINWLPDDFECVKKERV